MDADPTNAEALEAWKKSGGPRPVTRPEDSVLTRIDKKWMTDLELAIMDLAQAVKNLGDSASLDEAVRHLAAAQLCVADHVEDKRQKSVG